jgi:AcrR family transcriptional regulator
MDDVARAAGITKASIYHHVSGKEALLERGLNRALDALFAILAEPAACDGPPAPRLRHIVKRVAEITLALLPEVSVLFRLRGSSLIQRAAFERRRAFDRIIAELVECAQRDGTLRPDVDARLITRLVFGMSNSVVEWYRAGSSIGAAQLSEALVCVAFDGISQPHSPPAHPTR